MTTPSPELRQIRDRCVVDVDDFEWWLSQKGWSLRGLDAGEYGFSLEQAQLRYVCEDPVLWARAFLNDPDAQDGPWEFFDYQVPSVRAWYQDVVHQDGAEVGKTREIIVLLAWGMCTAFGFSVEKPWVLVGAPQQTHLDEIIMALEAHLGVSAEATGKTLLQRFWRKPKRTPHYLAMMSTPLGSGRIYFRPAGHDGEAFRGVHVNAMAIMDEAAKLHNRTIWSEFRRAKKPECIERVYSVPDGRRETEYYRLTQQAIPNLAPDREGVRLFHWPKTLMPAPYWSEERKRKYIRDYGGVDSPGYQRNVLGLHGQAENPVFPWATLKMNLRDVPAYRAVRLTLDRQNAELQVDAYRGVRKDEDGDRSARMRTLADRDEDLAPFTDSATRRAAVYDLLAEFIEPAPDGVYWAGADLGFAKDPTELRIWRELGAELRCVVRVSARGVDYDLQCELFHALDRLFGWRPRWGVDFGNAGTAVVQMLQHLELYAEGNYEERMTGFQFSSALDAIDEDGHVLTKEDDKTGEDKAVRLPAKELATNLVLARMQRTGFIMPEDEDVVTDYSNHTAREGAKHRIFAKDADHVIDADRAMMLRKVFDEQVGYADVFSSGVYVRGAA